MNKLEELQDKENKLYNELNQVRKEIRDFFIKDFKNLEGKYFRFTQSSIYEGFIKINRVWASKENIFLEGLKFCYSYHEEYADMCYADVCEDFQGRYPLDIRSYEKVEDFSIEEIPEDDFFIEYSNMIKCISNIKKDI